MNYTHLNRSLLILLGLTISGCEDKWEVGDCIISEFDLAKCELQEVSARCLQDHTYKVHYVGGGHHTRYLLKTRYGGYIVLYASGYKQVDCKAMDGQ